MCQSDFKMQRVASPRRMAATLNNTVSDLRDAVACRQQLGFAGWSDAQITEHLAEAQLRARVMREYEIERLAGSQYA